MKLKIYGCRGSTAFSRNSSYGGNTSCTVLESESGVIVFDAGSGILQYDAELRAKYPGYPLDLPFRPNILLSHLHVDHIQGLTGFSPIWTPGTNTRIFTCTRDEMPLADQIFGMFVPPYWPVPMATIHRAECIEVSGSFDVDGYRVTPFPSKHPDKTIAFHVTDGKKVIVYLLDSEISFENKPELLLHYCHKADLVIFDAAYTGKDYSKRTGWGHSTVEDGLELVEMSDCKRILFSHYGQEYSDEELDALKKIVPDKKQYLFAREGMEIEI